MIITISLLIILSGCETKIDKIPDKTTTSTTVESTVTTTNTTSQETTTVKETYNNNESVVWITKDTNMLYVISGDSDISGSSDILISFPVSCSKDLKIGEYDLKSKERWIKYTNETYAQYAMTFTQDIVISSALYFAMDKNTLLKNIYDQIGKENLFKGRIYTQVDGAKWLYDNLNSDVKIRVISEAPEGLSKKQTIPINMERAFTDPTEEAEGDQEDFPYYIYVEKGSATISIFKKDNNGEYSIPIKAYRTSVGKTIGRTPVGVFEVGMKERWHEFKYPYDGGFAQYATTFYKNIMIHAPIYSAKDINTMTPEFYNEIGGKNTAGCLRTLTGAAYWIYTYCDAGTTVEVVNSDPKGTTSEDIPPIDPEYPNTDPTDPFKKNKITEPTMSVSDCGNSGYVNIRSGPGTNYPVLARLADNTDITVIEENNNWYRVNFLNSHKDAYIIRDFIQLYDPFKEPFTEKQYAYVSSSTKDEVIDNLVDLRAVDSSIIIDLSFSHEDNFTGKVLYPNEICLLQKETAQKLAKAQKRFQQDGYSIKVCDAYRPFSIQQILFELISDPKYIADPNQASHHNRGAAVDMTLVDQFGSDIEFLTPVHSFSEESSAESQLEDPKTKEIFEYFVAVMVEAGFYNYEAEWWHFSDVDFRKYMVTDHDLSQVMIYNEYFE